MNTSYKRYWEPSTTQAVSSSLFVGLLAQALTQPIELVKTRIQQRAEGIGIRQIGIYAGYNPHKVFREVHAQGLGLSGFYAGLDAALLSRGVHLFVRNLSYKLIYDQVKPKKPTNDLTLREKAVLSGFAGTLAAIASNPLEVIAVRAQADGALAHNRRRNYTSFIDGYTKILSAEGTSGLFAGVKAHILKAIVLNASFTAPYIWMKDAWWNTFGDMACNTPVALLWGAAVATACTLPFDNLKFRFQYAFNDKVQNRINYAGVFDAIKKVVLVEGWQSFWVGYYAFFYKTAIYGICTVYAMDWITTGWKKSAGLKPEFI